MKNPSKSIVEKLQSTSGAFDSGAVLDIGAELRRLLADVFVLYIKTKNFHWHMSGSHFRDYHLLLDEQADQLFGITDAIAERARKIGAYSLLSVSDISAHQRLHDNNDVDVKPDAMLAELCDDNLRLATNFRGAHALCAGYNDVATTSLLELWIDEAERRVWFLAETAR